MWVKNQASVLELCSIIERSDVVALDTEFAAERRYYPRFDLLQVATSEMAAAVDVHANLDLTPLYNQLLEPGRTVVAHAGGQDFNILFRRTDRVPSRVFDTQVASAMVGYGTMMSFVALVRRVTGITLAKTETLTDWSKRPLRPAQIEYALDDVRYLLPLYTHLTERLEVLGRMPWFDAEMSRQNDPARFATPDLRERWRKVSGWANLTPRQLLVLQELTAWREGYAMDKDMPPRAILPDDVLVHLSRRPPSGIAELREIRQIFERTIQSCGAEMLAAVQRGMTRPEAEAIEMNSALAEAQPELPAGLVTLLDAVVRARADAQSIAPGLLVAPGDLERLVQEMRAGRPCDIDLLSGWRLDLVGNDVLRVLRGEAVVQVAPEIGLLLIDAPAHI